LLRQRPDKIRILLVKGLWGTLGADKEILESDNYQASSGIFHYFIVILSILDPNTSFLTTIVSGI
jgi:hypothetical protein